MGNEAFAPDEQMLHFSIMFSVIQKMEVFFNLDTIPT